MINTVINIILLLAVLLLSALVIVGAATLVIAALVFGVGLGAVLVGGLVPLLLLSLLVFVLFYTAMELVDKIKW